MRARKMKSSEMSRKQEGREEAPRFLLLSISYVTQHFGAPRFSLLWSGTPIPTLYPNATVSFQLSKCGNIPFLMKLRLGAYHQLEVGTF